MRYLTNQFIEIDGVEPRNCGRGFGIFGNDNVSCLGEAPYPVQFAKAHNIPVVETIAERAEMTACAAGNVGAGNRPNCYAQAIGMMNALCEKRARVFAAAQGLTAEVTANWRNVDVGTVGVAFDCTYMGHEITGDLSAKITQTECESTGDTIFLCGGGRYRLMKSDIYSSALTRTKMIFLVLDNGGLTVINKLQNSFGNESFYDLIEECPAVPAPFTADFDADARSMGAAAETVSNTAELTEVIKRAKAADKTSVIVMKVALNEGWTTGGDVWWVVGTAKGLDNPNRREKHAERIKQRQGV